MLLAGTVMADLSLVAGVLVGATLKADGTSPLTTSAKGRGGGMGLPCWDSGVSGTAEHSRSLLADPDLGVVVELETHRGTVRDGAVLAWVALDGKS